MSEPEKPIESATAPTVEYLPAAETLQFRKADHATVETGSGPPCAICSRRIVDTYFHANGKVVCPSCADKLQAVQTAPPAHTLLKSFIYGLGAALAGTALFSAIWIVSLTQWALISILIGYMVAKAIRYASGGLGGRPQQILAALLTYFSVAMAIVPVLIYHNIQKNENVSAAMVLAYAFVGLGSPFLAMKAGASGILTLLITFFGIQRAWRMTGRSNVLVMGPYQQGS